MPRGDNSELASTKRKGTDWRFSFAPFSPEQFEAFRATFIDCARGDPAARDVLFKKWWPCILAAAQECEVRTALHDQGRNPNVWRHLNTAVRCGDLRLLRDKNHHGINALLYGAMRAGLIEPVEDTTDYTQEIKALESLNRADLSRALGAAKSPGSILRVDSGKKRPVPADDYAQVLANVYFVIRGVLPKPGWVDVYDDGRRKGPTIRFFSAALAPIRPDLRPHGIAKMIRRVSKNVEG